MGCLVSEDSVMKTIDCDRDLSSRTVALIFRDWHALGFHSREPILIWPTEIYREK